MSSRGAFGCFAEGTQMIAERVVETNGIRLHIQEAGEGPLAILCHGFPKHLIPGGISFARSRTLASGPLPPICEAMGDPTAQRRWKTIRFFT